MPDIPRGGRFLLQVDFVVPSASTVAGCALGVARCAFCRSRLACRGAGPRASRVRFCWQARRLVPLGAGVRDYVPGAAVGRVRGVPPRCAAQVALGSAASSGPSTSSSGATPSATSTGPSASNGGTSGNVSITVKVGR